MTVGTAGNSFQNESGRQEARGLRRARSDPAIVFPQCYAPRTAAASVGPMSGSSPNSDS